MPQTNPTVTVSFKLPVHSDSQQNVGYKTVHVIVVKPKVQDNADDFQVIAGPLIFVFLIAVFILFVFSKVRPGTMADKFLSRLERFSTKSGNL